MPHQAFTVTRTFGLKPPREQRICFDDVFGQSLSLGNLFIRAGLQLGDSWFSKQGREAVKAFYDEVRKEPRVAAWLTGTHLRERACRCIAQNAYFALRGHVEREQMLSIVASILLSLGGDDGFSMFTASFPAGELVATAMERLGAAGVDRATFSPVFIRNTTCQARNIIRAAMLQDHGGDLAALLGTIASSSVPFIDLHEVATGIHVELAHLAERFMKTFAGRLTRCFKQLGKGTSRGGAPSPSPSREALDALVRNIYDGTRNATTGNPILAGKPLSRATWDRRKRAWRDVYLHGLLQWIGSVMSPRIVEFLVHDAWHVVVPSLTVERVLSCLFKPRVQDVPRCRATGASPRDFDEWLVKVVERRVEQSIIAAIGKHVAPWTRDLLQRLQADPGQWMGRPVIKGRAIPLGQDDGQVYRLNVESNEATSCTPAGELAAVPGCTSVFVTLSFYSGPRVKNATGATRDRVDAVEKGGFSFEPARFQLHRRDVARFLGMIDGGFEPKQPTITLRRDGKLVIGIPFEAVPVTGDGDGDEACNEPAIKHAREIDRIVSRTIDEWIERDENDALAPIINDGWDRLDEHWNPPVANKSNGAVVRIVKSLRHVAHSGVVVACSGDLGLKTDVVASIERLLRFADGSYSLANIHRREDARYFITQEQLRGTRREWFLPGFDPSTRAAPGNPKRALHHLAGDIRHLQSIIDTFKNEHPGDYMYHPCSWEMHEQLAKKWQKVCHIHDELTRQIATRLVAICEHHDVDVIRLENLSWSRHSRKEDVGYYLRSNQIHWFFSQVQQRATWLAHARGIDVELVNARYTSQTCSRCHERGNRNGKTFKCPHCGLQLDSDLNAARNIAVAPASPFGTFKAPRGIPPRATRVRGPALPRPLFVEPQPLTHAT